MVSGLVLRVFSLSLDLTFIFRTLSISRTSLRNGIPLSFSHSRRRHCVLSSICSSITVMGLHQSVEVVGDSSDFSGKEGPSGLIGMGLGQVVGVDES